MKGEGKMEMKGALMLPKISPSDVILESLAKTFSPFDRYEEKKLKEWDEIKRGSLTLIFRKEKK
jgi:hypothetical protein